MALWDWLERVRLHCGIGWEELSGAVGLAGKG